MMRAHAFPEPKEKAPARYVHCLKKITDVMVNDVASPVAASRYYAYVNLAAYEAAALRGSVPSLKGLVNDYNGFEVSKEQLAGTDPDMTILLTMLKAGERLLPSGYMVKTTTDSLVKLYAPSAGTIALADSLVAQLMRYVARDRFNKLNNMPRYVLKQGDGYWKPTPPVFMAPIEPHWNSLRTFTLDSAQQFKPQPPAAYDTSRNSSFFRQLMEVYEVGRRANKKEQDIANFWDCNPFAVQQIGHVEFGLKKISPGGHWVGITGIACLKKGLSLEQTARVHAVVSLALADAFIVCWDEKYRSNRVRPETAIQRLIDPTWRPLLQTPPFPEYVSGHSAASNAAATVLTAIFGQNFSFTDDTEVEFNLPRRDFRSFEEAAAEASVSRLYGGIHYRDAIDQGVWQGRQVGKHVTARLQKLLVKL